MTTSTIAVQPVESSQISDVGYCQATSTLCIFFKQKDGRSKPYHYPCTEEQYGRFMAAPSKGAHFGKHIKNNPAMPHTKIVETDEERAIRKASEVTA